MFSQENGYNVDHKMVLKEVDVSGTFLDVHIYSYQKLYEHLLTT
jgi:hypothetical protein